MLCITGFNINNMKKYKCNVCNEIKPENLFYKNGKKNVSRTIRGECKKCSSINTSEYMNTEEGFMKKLYSSMKDRQKIIKRSFSHIVELNLEEFLELWHEYKKKYGMICFYTGVKLDFIKKAGRGTQVSVDRIDNNEGYTKNNIIFCSARANFEKHSVSIDMCRKILALYEERQGTGQ